MAARRWICLLLSPALLGLCQAQLKDGCKMETLRACGDDYVPYSKQTRLHESGQEFTDGCAKDTLQVGCTLKFIDECLRGLPQAAAQLAVEAIEESIEAVCIVGSEPYNEYQKNVKCMNSVGAKLHICSKDIHGNLERALAKAPPEDIIAYACCAYHNTTECLSKALTPCERSGGKDFLLNVMEQILGGTLDLICGSYTRGSDDCKALPSLPPLGPKDPRMENFVELVIGIATTLGRKS